MKTVPFVLLLALPLAMTAAEVRPGDTLTNVRATLGVPRGQLLTRGRQLLYYERGEIELQAGAVTRVALLSVDDHASREARRAAAAVRIREEQEIRRARLSTEGEALKARKLADPSFLATPLAYQVAFWEDFSRRYPEVASAEQLTIARLRFAEQFEEKRARALQEERRAELEDRLIAAEARASASRHRSYTSFSSGYAHHPFTFWPIEYRFYDSPLPYAASPSQFSVTPTFRTEYPRFSAAPTDHNPHHDRRDSHSCNRHSGRGNRF